LIGLQQRTQEEVWESTFFLILFMTFFMYSVPFQLLNFKNASQSLVAEKDLLLAEKEQLINENEQVRRNSITLK